MKDAPTLPTITYIIGSLEIGGAEMHLSQVAPASKRHGVDVEVISLSPNIPLRAPFEEAGITIHAPSTTSFPLPTLLKRMVNLVKRTIFLMRLLLKRREHVLHFFLPEAYILGMVVSLITRHRAMRVMSRRSMNYYQQKRRILGLLEHRLHPLVDAILCNSAAIKTQLIREEGVLESKVSLIYNGVSEERMTTNTEVNPRKNAPLHLVCIANLIPYKGHSDLIKALIRIKDDLPQDWQLTLIGQDRGVKENLLSMMNQAGITSHIHFIHDCSNPVPYLPNATVGVLPSHEEGFSNAILEMMAAGLPVIATDVGGNAEAVQDGVNGLIVPPKDPVSLSTAILTLAKDGEKSQAMGQMSLKIFKEHFSLTACVDAYRNFYQTLLKS